MKTDANAAYAKHVARVQRQCLAVRALCCAALVVGAIAGVLVRVAFTDPLAGPSRR